MNPTIFKRLIFSHVAIMLFVVFLGIYLPIKLNQINDLISAAASVDGTTINLIERILDSIYSQVSFSKKYIISRDEDFNKQSDELKNYVTEDLATLEIYMDSPSKKKRYANVKSLYESYYLKFDQEVTFIKADRLYDHEQFLQDKNIYIDGIEQDLKEITKLARTDRDGRIRSLSEISAHMIKVIPLTALLCIVMGILISYFISRSIIRSIFLLQEKTKEIAKGKFSKIPHISTFSEIKALADHFNIMCERLEELDEMKSDFISHVSHELRTPLTAIKEASSMLLEGFSDTPEQSEELLTIVYQECERLINAVNRILDLSCMEADMMDYHFCNCSVIPVIQNSILKLAPIARKQDINLELKPPPDLPSVKIDEERVGQILENLIGNALKFTEPGDSVVVDVSVNDSKADFIKVMVSDTGCGIQKENLEIIFSKFQRIDSGKETTRGTGLGLPITKYIVTAHGGKIWVKSEPGKGSTFLFTLPAS